MPRKARLTFQNTVGQLFPIRSRMGLHLSVVAAVALTTVVGGRIASSPTMVASQIASVPAVAAAPAPSVAGQAAPTAPAPAALASAPKAASQPSQAAAPAYAALNVAQPAALVATGSQVEVAEAPALPVDIKPEQLAMAPEDGVVMVRALSSYRGGLRAPSTTPTAVPAPQASPAPTAEPEKEPREVQSYKVQSGDTLLGIAEKFGITPETILWANDLGNGEMLQIDEELAILPVSGVLHKVKKGETFKDIAGAYVADAKELIQANGIADADLLQEGQILIVPGGMMLTTEITGLPLAPSATELAKAPKHVVEPGDSLLSIADSFGVLPSAIQLANNLMDPDSLQIGQELKIPGGEAPPAAAPAAPKPAAPAAAPKPAAPAPAPKPAAPAPKPAPKPVPSGSGGALIASIAQQYLGHRYVWGGTTPAGFDCSGLTWYVYKQAGISIPRSPLSGQLNAGPRISRDQLEPGDLLFWQNTYKAGISHAGIYLGGGRFINAETEASGVQIRSMSDPYWAARYLGASRPY